MCNRRGALLQGRPYRCAPVEVVRFVTVAVVEPLLVACVLSPP
jgi:hypothetical protein